LHAAVKGSHDAVVQQLLGKGPDLNLKDKNGCTPLHLAIDRGQDSVVQQLLEKGAGINLKDKYGYTPLHLAIDRRNGATVQLLVAKGADARWDADTPLHGAASKGHLDVVQKPLTLNPKP
ncbi:ankyrin repeat protein, partial [Baffinella frigidus]